MVEVIEDEGAKRSRDSSHLKEWIQAYRPQTLEECALPQRIKEQLQLYIDRRFIPNLIFAGSPGIGKSTVAKVLGNYEGTDCYEVNCANVSSPKEFKQQVDRFVTSASLFGKTPLGKKVIILEESNELSKQTLAYLKKKIEDTQEGCAWILTTNVKGEIPSAILSRCNVVDFNILPDRDDEGEMLDQVSDLIQEYAKRDGCSVDWEDKKVKTNLQKIFKRHFPDIRKIISEVNIRCTPKGYIPIALSEY